MLMLCPATLPIHWALVVFGDVFGFPCIVSCRLQTVLVYYFLCNFGFPFFSFLIAVVRTSETMLNKVEIGYPCLVSDPRRQSLFFTAE